MRELGMRVIALQTLVLNNFDKFQWNPDSKGTQTTPKSANNGAKRLRELPQAALR